MTFVGALLAGLLAASAPVADSIRIDGRDIYPESLSSDSSGRIYAGSIPGIVYRTTPNGTVATPWIRPDAANGLLALQGVLVDERSHTLWVCSTPFPFRTPPAVGTSALVAFDLASGRLKARYPFPPPASSCNDVAIDASGTAFVTDTPNGRIFRLVPGSSALEPFAADPAAVGIDGIAFSADGTLYTNNVRKHSMQRVERNPDGSFVRFVPLTLSQPVAGPDGLRPIGDNRFLQAESGGATGKVSQVTIEGDSATLRTLWQGGEPTPGVTPSPRGAFTAEGKAGHLFDPRLKAVDPNPFSIRPVAAH